MDHGRREVAPKDQIKALRLARDRYAELADRIHNDTESVLDAAEKQLREDDARRIAKAYDKSLSNSVARLSGMEGTHNLTTRSLWLWYRMGALLLLVCLLFFAYRYASSRDGLLNRRELGIIASNGLPADSAPPAGIPPPAVLEQNPLPEKPEAAKNPAPDARKPVIASTVPAPKKIDQPPSPLTKNPRETANAQPASQALQKRPETTTAAAPAPAQLAPASPAPAPPALTPPTPAQPTPAQPAPAQPVSPAPLPALAAPLSPPVAAPAPVVVAAIPPPSAIPPAPSAIRPEPITETHTLPRYPQLSAQIGETGTTRMSVGISPQGQAADCRITQSSGSERLDGAACAQVTDHWRWKPFTQGSTAPAPRVSVTMVWNLSKPSRGR